MSAPYGQPGGQPTPYGDQQGAQDQQQQQAAAYAVPFDHKKKKRAYAADAFSVGSGANVPPGGQLPAGGQYGAPLQPVDTPAYGGYGSPSVQDPQVAQYGVPQPAAGAAASAPGAAGGYQYQQPYYPGTGPPAVGGVDALTAGVAGMSFGGAGQPQVQQPQQQPSGQAASGRAGPLNQLYPTDLLSQPFNVAELEFPPPPIILPPNVSCQPWDASSARNSENGENGERERAS